MKNIQKKLQAVFYSDIKSSLISSGVDGHKAISLIREYRKIIFNVLTVIDPKRDKEAVESDFILFDSPDDALKFTNYL